MFFSSLIAAIMKKFQFCKNHLKMTLTEKCVDHVHFGCETLTETGLGAHVCHQFLLCESTLADDF